MRRLAAVWFADIVGFTELSSRDEDAAMKLVELFQTATRRAIPERGGTVVKFLGDGGLAVFPSSDAAARAGLAVQREFAERASAAGHPAALRIGIHVGEVIGAPDGDVYGDGVNIAARMQREAEPGQVVVSGDVRRQLRQRSGYQFQVLGERLLRGVEEPVEICVVVEGPPDERLVDPGAGSGARRSFDRRTAVAVAAIVLLAIVVASLWRFVGRDGSRDAPGEATGAVIPAPGRGAAEASIAVLPFDNMSADPDNEYFADGLAEEILNALANVPGLRVAARTSSFSFKDRNADIPTIAQALGVRTVLEGSVRKSGDRVRITAQLINAEDGLHLWSETYDRDLDDIFAVQEEIARSIVAALEVRLAPGGELVERPTESQEAYEEYLRGRFLWNRRTVEPLQAAVGHFERAVELDPEFALAWAGLADAHLTLPWYLGRADWDAILESGREAAERALAIDPDLAQAHAALGLYHASRFEWGAADEEFRRGLELDPRYSTGHYWYAFSIAPQGRLDEAIEHARIAAELEPLSLINVRGYAWILMWSGRYEEALAQADRVNELDPNFAPNWGVYARTYAVQGRWREATQAFVRLAELSGWNPEAIRHATAAMERRAREGRPVPIPEDLGMAAPRSMLRSEILATLGQPDSAMAVLQRMHDEGDPNLRDAGIHPLLAPLHHDPRFVALLERIGLAPVEAARAWMRGR